MIDYSPYGSRTETFRCVSSVIITLGAAALFIWIGLRTTNPVLSIQDVYIPALNRTLNSTAYQSIYIDLKLDNENKDKGIYYDPLNITLHYYTNVSDTNTMGNVISNYTLRGFYQGKKKHTRRKNWAETNGVPWDDMVGLPTFRVDLVTAVRFRILFFKTKRHRLVIGADFEVNDRGMKVDKKGTRLKSDAPELFSSRSRVASLFIAFATLVVLVFI